MDRSTPDWEPILCGPAAEAALAVVRNVVGEAAEAAPSGGAAGDLALLLSYAAQAGLDVDLRLAEAGLDELVRTAGPTAGLWGGASGVLLRVTQLAGGEEAAEVCRDLTARVERLLDRPRWEGHYDLIGGLVGFGVAALERIDQPDGERLARRVLDHLEATARDEAAGLTWFTEPRLLPDWQRERCPNGYHNLGLAHGVPGVIGLLSRFVAAGFERDRSRRLLDRAVAWLLDQSVEGGEGRFPQWIPAGAAPEPPSLRLAWCYGDLGVAVSLLGAAVATGDASLRAVAMGLARTLAAVPVERSQVRDAGLCHGAAGVAHVFGRMYRATGDDRLQEAATAWLDRLLAMRRPEAPIAGFPAVHYDPDTGWVDRAEVDLLTGASGVALTLLAAATDVEPAWDRALLVDLPPSWEAA